MANKFFSPLKKPNIIAELVVTVILDMARNALLRAVETAPLHLPPAQRGNSTLPLGETPPSASPQAGSLQKLSPQIHFQEAEQNEGLSLAVLGSRKAQVHSPPQAALWKAHPHDPRLDTVYRQFGVQPSILPPGNPLLVFTNSFFVGGHKEWNKFWSRAPHFQIKSMHLYPVQIRLGFKWMWISSQDDISC